MAWEAVHDGLLDRAEAALAVVEARYDAGAGVMADLLAARAGALAGRCPPFMYVLLDYQPARPPKEGPDEQAKKTRTSMGREVRASNPCRLRGRNLPTHETPKEE